MIRTTLAVTATLAFGAARAQLVAPDQTPEQAALAARPPVAAPVFRDAFQPFPRLSVRNGEARPALKSPFDLYRTDPKLQLGLELTPTFGIELGFANLLSRGFHYVEDGRASEKAGVLGDHGFTSYAAARFTVPVTERFTAYSKLGVAYSQTKLRQPADQGGHTSALKETAPRSDLGPYASMGARYKLNDKATLSGEVVKSGNSADKWSASNATGVSTKLKIGF